LLSPGYDQRLAAQVQSAVADKKPIAIQLKEHLDDGTVHISSVDRDGNMVALTLTHGGVFGSQVTIEGLGLTLGHGMSRFDPHPGHPNAPAPGKRPLTNMCPTVVLRQGKPILAVGASGGVKIPNALFDVLTNFVARRDTMFHAIEAPRLNCTGTLTVGVEPAWPKVSIDYLKEIGFKVSQMESAHVGAVSFDPDTGESKGQLR